MRLYVASIGAGFTLEELGSRFGRYGEVSDLVRIGDGRGRTKAAFVSMPDPREARAAMAALSCTAGAEDLLLILPALAEPRSGFRKQGH